MRARIGGGLVCFALAAASVVACTFIVDGETKDLSGTCTPAGANATACGRCVVRSCQNEINANCASTNGEIGDLERCIQNPRPSSNDNLWNCSNILSDAALHTPTNDSIPRALNTCVSQHCTPDCTACTDIDAGTGACGSCIIQQCGSLLNGTTGCCDNDSVRSGIASCTAAAGATCKPFFDIAGDSGPDSGDASSSSYFSCADDSPKEFALCVFTNCSASCPK